MPGRVFTDQAGIACTKREAPLCVRPVASRARGRGGGEAEQRYVQNRARLREKANYETKNKVTFSNGNEANAASLFLRIKGGLIFLPEEKIATKKEQQNGDKSLAEKVYQNTNTANRSSCR